MKLLTLLATLSIAALAPAADTPAKVPAELQADYAKLTPAQKGKLTRLINHADLKTLEALPAIGAKNGAALIKARPFENALDLLRVTGIGEGSIGNIIAAAAKDTLPEVPEAEPKGKATPKKKAPAPKKEGAPEPKKKTADEPKKAP